MSTPGLLESRGRIPLEQMWVSPCPLNTGINLNVQIFILKLQPMYSKIILRYGHTFFKSTLFKDLVKKYVQILFFQNYQQIVICL